MRRRGSLAALVVALVAAVAAVLAPTGGAADTFRVDAIFSNAGFLIPGQSVKIAGAVAGEVVDVSLTEDRRARISMEVDRRFAPFRADARCTIQPESLIGEKFLQCAPGTADAAALREDATGVPTVPLDRTVAPVDLDLVLAGLRQPTPQRLSLFLSALGAGLTGRGEDLDTAIRRAVPTLGRTQALLDQVTRDRATLRQLIADSDRVLETLAGRRRDVRRFIASSGRVAATVAERRDRLAGTLRRLPGLLRAARPALADLEALGLSGTPAVADLRAAAPDATRLVEALPAFARRATPAVRDLGAAAAIGEPALRDAAPQVRRVRRLADGLQPVASMTADLFESMREKGAVEGLLRFVYYATVAQARFDSTSHVLPAQAIADGTCSLYATTTVKGCDANFAAGGRTAARKARPKRTPKRRPAPAPSRPEVPAVSPAAAVPATPAARPSVPEQVTSVVDRVLDLLRPKKDGEPQPVQPVQQVLDRLLGPGAQAEREQRDGLAGALDYLLGG